MPKRRALTLLGVALLIASCNSSPSPSPVPSSDPTGIFTGRLDLRANLNTEQVVTPTGKPWKPPARIKDAAGTFEATLDAEQRTLTWDLSLDGLGEPSLKIVDVHLGERGEFGAVLVRLCGPCEKEEPGGVAMLSQSEVGDFATKPTWVTLVIEGFPNGVIRGQIKSE